MNVIHIGSKSEYVEIRLPTSYAKDRWAQADVEIVVQGFRGEIRPWFDAADFEQFAKELRSLYETLKGEANLIPLDRQLTLKLIGTIGGHVKVAGEAWSKATYENKLVFELEIDQTFLPGPLNELESLNVRDV